MDDNRSIDATKPPLTDDQFQDILRELRTVERGVRDARLSFDRAGRNGMTRALALTAFTSMSRVAKAAHEEVWRILDAQADTAPRG